MNIREKLGITKVKEKFQINLFFYKFKLETSNWYIKVLFRCLTYLYIIGYLINFENVYTLAPDLPITTTNIFTYLSACTTHFILCCLGVIVYPFGAILGWVF
jgi:hypothetical protein